ncbi:hypothetical protein J4231_00830 [Candidatus Woesearchaeota archaeon]|nr:hypothetical protein [Candidatus Woesearchaeota archaeon]
MKLIEIVFDRHTESFKVKGSNEHVEVKPIEAPKSLYSENRCLERVLEINRPKNTNAFCRSDFSGDNVVVQYHRIIGECKRKPMPDERDYTRHAHIIS